MGARVFVAGDPAGRDPRRLVGRNGSGRSICGRLTVPRSGAVVVEGSITGVDDAVVAWAMIGAGLVGAACMGPVPPSDALSMSVVFGAWPDRTGEIRRLHDANRMAVLRAGRVSIVGPRYVLPVRAVPIVARAGRCPGSCRRSSR